jgi:hypothetical protein
MLCQLAHLSFVTDNLSKISDFCVKKLGMDHSRQTRTTDLAGSASEAMEYSPARLALTGR